MLLIMCLCIVIHAHIIDYLPGGVLVHLRMHSAHSHQQVYHSFSSIYVLCGQTASSANVKEYMTVIYWPIYFIVLHSKYLVVQTQTECQHPQCI